jgi:hypothetical protein
MTAPFSQAGFRPLLPAGIHPSDWSGLRRLCVDYFPASATRPRLMTTLTMLARLVNEASIPARLWIGGDLLTEKINPTDFSIAVVLIESVYNTLSGEQIDFFDWFRQSSFFDEYHCETYGMILDAGRSDWEFLYKYWLNQYGMGRTSISSGVIEILMPSLVSP